MVSRARTSATEAQTRQARPPAARGAGRRAGNRSGREPLRQRTTGLFAGSSADRLGSGGGGGVCGFRGGASGSSAPGAEASTGRAHVSGANARPAYVRGWCARTHLRHPRSCWRSAGGSRRQTERRRVAERSARGSAELFCFLLSFVRQAPTAGAAVAPLHSTPLAWLSKTTASQRVRALQDVLTLATCAFLMTGSDDARSAAITLCAISACVRAQPAGPRPAA
jgi:hypothetical protein